jgi:hypothetical protein
MAAVATHVDRDGGPAGPRTEGSAKRLFEPGGPTLEDVVLGAWEELVADGRAECPVCGGAMSILGGCGECGSDLS